MTNHRVRLDRLQLLFRVSTVLGRGFFLCRRTRVRGCVRGGGSLPSVVGGG